jgi:hypothetical protein
MQPAGPAFFWRGFRTIPGESPPRKVDEAIFYMGLGGKAWRIHSNESSDHWNYVMSSSGVDGLMQDWYLPAQRFGSLGSLLAHSTGINPMAPFDALEDSDATT